MVLTGKFTGNSQQQLSDEYIFGNLAHSTQKCCYVLLTKVIKGTLMQL